MHGDEILFSGEWLLHWREAEGKKIHTTLAMSEHILH